MLMILKAAKALLDAAGYTVGADGIRHGMCDGVDTKLSFNFETTDKQIRVDAALAAQSDLTKIGIEFKPTHLPAGTFFATYADGGDMAHWQVRYGRLHHRFLSRSHDGRA